MYQTETGNSGAQPKIFNKTDHHSAYTAPDFNTVCHNYVFVLVTHYVRTNSKLHLTFITFGIAKKSLHRLFRFRLVRLLII
jgi:hypothetical protein